MLTNIVNNKLLFDLAEIENALKQRAKSVEFHAFCIFNVSIYSLSTLEIHLFQATQQRNKSSLVN